MREELLSHIAMRAEDNLARGMSPEEARRDALLRLGNPAVIADRAWDADLATAAQSWWRDLALGLRSLRRSPGFALIVIVILGLGVGANTAVFTLTHAFLWRNLPVPQPGRLVRYMMTSASALPGMSPTDDMDLPISGPIFDALRKHQRSCTDLFLWTDTAVSWRNGPEQQSTPAALVTGGAFSVLGIPPALGRLLNYADDRRGGGPQGWAADLSYDFWQRQFHGDPAVLGKTLEVEHLPVTIVGVLPQGFHGILIGSNPRLILPWAFDVQVNGGRSDRYTPNQLNFTALGRLKPGATYSQALAEVRSMQSRVLNEAVPAKFQDNFFRMFRLDLRPGGTGFSDFNRTYRKPLLMMQLLVLSVLLVIGLNLSMLLMARASARRHELAVRAALGARRWRLLRQLLIEALLLAIPGSILALGLGAWGSHILFSIASRGDPNLVVDLHPDAAVLAATLGFALLAVFVSSLWPAWQVGRVDLTSAMQSGRQGRAHQRRSRFARFLLPAQVALSLLLVAVGGLFVASLTRILTQPSGMQAEHVLLANTNFYRGPEDSGQKLALYQRMLTALRQMPGVQVASASSMMPMNEAESDEGYWSRDAAGQRHEDRTLYENRVAPDLFSALGIPLLAGRDFSASDSQPADPVCILSQSAARFFFPTGSALGGYINNDDPSGDPATRFRVVGIVGNAKYDTLHEEPPRTIYFSYAQNPEHWLSMSFILRGPDQARLAAAFRAVMLQFAPGSAVPTPIALRRKMLQSVTTDRLLALLSGYLGALALLLSCTALYGVMSWNVALRTAEVGIRMALGATRYRILRLILGEALVVVAIGAIFGLAGTAGATRWIASFLFDTPPLDPGVLFAAAACMLTATAFAAWLPARRASRTEPMSALHCE